MPKKPAAGVWLVITDKGGYDEYLHAVFPGDQELEARRYQADLTYGDVQFEPFAKPVA